jgi:hypothetical protein
VLFAKIQIITVAVNFIGKNTRRIMTGSFSVFFYMAWFFQTKEKPVANINPCADEAPYSLPILFWKGWK